MSKTKINDNANIKEKQTKEQNIKNNNNRNYNNNIKYIKNNEIKGNQNILDKYKINNSENNKINEQNTKKEKTNVKKNNNPFNNPVINKNKDLINIDKNDKKNKEIINKRCKSSDKNNKNKHKNQSNNNKNRKTLKEERKQRTRTKTKSKAKKHSKKIKYIDKLKTFKYSETSYNIFYDSSTNYSNNVNHRNKKYALKASKSLSKKKKNINSFNLNNKLFEEDFKINKSIINDKYRNLKPQLSVRITLSKKNNVKVLGILRYFKVNYFCSENLRNEFEVDSEDTSEFYNAKF